MMYHWYDFLGNVGVVMMLIAFFLLQAQKMGAHDLSYLLLNGIGAILVLISLWFAFNLSAFAIETAWVAISVYGIVRVLRARKLS
jgi:paired small multidrug resistance pump